MEELKNKLLNEEGKEIEDNNNLEGTSPSTEAEQQPPVDPIPDLNSTPTPTAEEQEEANVLPQPESDAVEQEQPGEEQPVQLSENENVVEPPLPDTHSVFNEGMQEEMQANAEPTHVPVEPEMHEENGVFETPTKTFTQSQVDDIAGRTRLETREKTFRYIYDRYGVKDEAELDNLVGNAQRYDTLQEQYDMDKNNWKQADQARNAELCEVKEKVALMESGINKDRYEDAKLILKGKGLEVTAENIANELATHPEWANQPAPQHEEFRPIPQEPESQISVLGNESAPADDHLSEEDYAMKHLFKL